MGQPSSRCQFSKLAFKEVTVVLSDPQSLALQGGWAVFRRLWCCPPGGRNQIPDPLLYEAVQGLPASVSHTASTSLNSSCPPGLSVGKEGMGPSGIGSHHLIKEASVSPSRKIRVQASFLRDSKLRRSLYLLSYYFPRQGCFCNPAGVG